MSFSEQAQAIVAYKVQSGLGVQATGAGGERLRVSGGGAQIQKNAVESREVRQDAQSTRGRHGSQRTTGEYETELSTGNMDTIFEALFRGTWGTADVEVSEGDMSSATIAVATNVITASAGSWITAGYRVGDVVTESVGLVAGNQNRDLRITALTATAMTVLAVDGAVLTDEAGPIASYTFTRTGRVLVNPLSGALVKRYFTVDEHDILIDGSEIYTDAVWTSMTLSMSPDGLFMANPSFSGTGQYETVTAVSAPLLTGPTASTGLPMAAIDAVVRLGTGDVVDLTSFEMTIDTVPDTPATVASVFAPDVFQGSMTLGMNLTMLRSDLLDVADFINETQLSLSCTVVDPDGNYIHFHVPNFTFGSVDKSALSKDGGARTQTIAVPSALIGIDEQGGAFDTTTLKIQVSNAS